MRDGFRLDFDLNADGSDSLGNPPAFGLRAMVDDRFTQIMDFPGLNLGFTCRASRGVSQYGFDLLEGIMVVVIDDDDILVVACTGSAFQDVRKELDVHLRYYLFVELF